MTARPVGATAAMLAAFAAFAALAGCGAPPVADAVAVAPAPAAASLQAWWAAPQEPLDTTAITPVESAGASGSD